MVNVVVSKLIKYAYCLLKLTESHSNKVVYQVYCSVPPLAGCTGKSSGDSSDTLALYMRVYPSNVIPDKLTTKALIYQKAFHFYQITTINPLYTLLCLLSLQMRMQLHTYTTTTHYWLTIARGIDDYITGCSECESPDPWRACRQGPSSSIGSGAGRTPPSGDPR